MELWVCSSSVVEKSHREAAQPRNEFKAQPQTNAQTFSSFSSRLIHSDAFFFLRRDRWQSSQSKRMAIVCPWLKAQDLPLLLDQVCMTRNKNYSEKTNLFSDRIMVLMVSYLYDNLIFCVVRFAINYSHALEQPTSSLEENTHPFVPPIKPASS